MSNRFLARKGLVLLYRRDKTVPRLGNHIWLIGVQARLRKIAILQ
jgi:hypothetical protein